MDQNKVDLSHIEIAPLTKGMGNGAFSSVEEPFTHLANWFTTQAVTSTREKKSKTYVAMHDNRVIGFISLSNHYLAEIPGQKNTTSHDFQVLLVGKLLVEPEMRSCGIGKILVDFAVDIAANIDQMVGCIGVIVDANSDARTVAFYQKYGFEALDSDDKEDTVKMFFKLTEEPNI